MQEVFPDGLVAGDGRLQPGDQIIEINGVDMTCATHTQVSPQSCSLFSISHCRLYSLYLLYSMCSLYSLYSLYSMYPVFFLLFTEYLQFRKNTHQLRGKNNLLEQLINRNENLILICKNLFNGFNDLSCVHFGCISSKFSN